jgi:hypothetical protein
MPRKEGRSEAAPIMLSVRHLGDDPVALQRAFD